MLRTLSLIETRIRSLRSELSWRESQVAAERKQESYGVKNSQRALFESYCRDIKDEISELEKAREILTNYSLFTERVKNPLNSSENIL